MKINRTANIIVAAFCLAIGLGLIGVGIYILAKGADYFSGGLLIGMGALVCVLFCLATYLIVRYDKLQKEAETQADAQKEKVRAFIELKMKEADELRAKSAHGDGAKTDDATRPVESDGAQSDDDAKENE